MYTLFGIFQCEQKRVESGLVLIRVELGFGLCHVRYYFQGFSEKKILNIDPGTAEQGSRGGHL